jgi:propanol-preferring alcohol dehydrogenase
MHAMVLESVGRELRFCELPDPVPGPNQVLVRVEACGVCRTDLHIVDGELAEPNLPLVPGHEIVGRVVQFGGRVTPFRVGDRVGVAWLGSTCGKCEYCRSGAENLCDDARFTGYQLPGGYAQFTVADSRYCFQLKEAAEAAALAPLMCAGLVGYRSYRQIPEGAQRLGFYGFGAAAHILAQVARHQGKRVYAFTRPGDRQSQDFARSLGAAWAGGSDEEPPEKLDAAIIFAPVGSLVPTALRAVRKGGVVVCAGIHMTDIPSFPYKLLWEERVVRSVANLTRQDGEEFLALASQIPVQTRVQSFPLHEANVALSRLRSGQIDGAAVLSMQGA